MARSRFSSGALVGSFFLRSVVVLSTVATTTVSANAISVCTTGPGSDGAVTTGCAGIADVPDSAAFALAANRITAAEKKIADQEKRLNVLKDDPVMGGLRTDITADLKKEYDDRIAVLLHRIEVLEAQLAPPKQPAKAKK
jgi:hypothetical protein